MLAVLDRITAEGPDSERRCPSRIRTTLSFMDESRSALMDRADAVFDRLSPYPGMGFRNHCFRLFEFTRQLLQASHLPFDASTAYAIAMMHDLGLVGEAPGENYLLRSLAIFEDTFRDEEVPESRQVIRECLLLNHRLLPVPNATPQAEAFRQAVWIEHSRGLKRYGLSKSAVDEVFELYPRDNLDSVLVDFFARTLRKEPSTIWNGIFLGPGPAHR